MVQALCSLRAISCPSSVAYLARKEALVFVSCESAGSLASREATACGASAPSSVLTIYLPTASRFRPKVDWGWIPTWSPCRESYISEMYGAEAATDANHAQAARW